MTQETLTTASVLAFERKLDISDALFYAGCWDDRDKPEWKPVPIREKSVRGTISNRLKTKDQDPAKLDAQIENPNLQTIDVATLPSDADTLKVVFTMRVLAGAGIPSACNNAAYKARLAEVVDGYIQEQGFTELARRYAFNLANGRFLWRNRLGAERVDVRVQRLVDSQVQQAWQFDALRFSLREFNVEQDSAQSIDELGALISAGLAGTQHVLLRVMAYVRLGAGQEVFPSQELVLNRSQSKSKTLYSVGQIAGIHSQKLGNAIRTIDTWHPDVEQLGPIAIEPYGSVTTLGKACRQPKAKVDFYNLLDNWLLKAKVPETGNQHYVMGVLVRGGVFGEAGS